MKKSAKFFCESCGAEVPPNAKFCRHCGRFFSSVRCPVCGETGSNEKFKNGCPNCGYAFNNGGSSKPSVEKHRHSRATKKNFRSAIRGKSAAFGVRASEDSLPKWIFALIAFLLFALRLGCYKYLSLQRKINSKRQSHNNRSLLTGILLSPFPLAQQYHC